MDPDGDSKPLIEPGTDKVPLGEVYIGVHSSAPNPRSAIPNSPCGVDAGQFATDRTNTLIWSPRQKQTEPDGSVVETTHATVGSGGTVTVAARVFKDNSTVTIAASDFLVFDSHGDLTFLQDLMDSSYKQGPIVTPSPWTDDLLAKALSGSDIHGL